MKITTIIEGTLEEVREYQKVFNTDIDNNITIKTNEDGITKKDGRITFTYGDKTWTLKGNNEVKKDGDKYFTYDEAIEYCKKLTDRHLPSIEEWREFLKAWCEYKGHVIDGNSVWGDKNNDKKIGNEFSKDFNIEYLGSRNYDAAKVYSQGSYAYLWSSSPNDDDDARGLYLNSSNVDANDIHYRAFGLSVRCFKNSF